MIFKAQILICFFVLYGFCSSYSQVDCNFKNDTVFIPKENKVINASYLQTALKNKSNFIIYKSDNNRYFVKLIVSENLYFNKIDLLEFKSGSKSIFFKDTKHFQNDKNSGYYVVEVWKNYIGTLTEDGITAIQFGKAETVYTKQDCNQIKQIAKCFYDNISLSKTKQKN
jgi:hypothetical protein